MRKLYFLLAAAATTLCSNAQTECQPGKLSQLVTDHNITTLTLTGSMDARDFKFISSDLRNLESLDLSAVTISGYEDLRNPIFGNEYSYAASTVPSMALAGMPKLTSVTLPQSVTSIGTAAFAACPSLYNVTLSDGLLNVGEYAFSACQALESITLPASLASVGQGAFSRCTSLVAVNVAASESTAQQLTICDEAFLNCAALSQVNLGENLTSIGNSAFAGTALTVLDLTQYKNLQSIGDWAYTLSQVSSATFPASLKKLGKGAFIYNQRLNHATLPAGLERLDDFTFAGNVMLDSIGLGNISSIGDYALYNMRRVEKLVIPQQVTSIGDKAMAGMTGLQIITTFPTAVPALGEEVWDGVDQKSVRLVTPSGSAHDYAEALQWKDFIVSYEALLGDADEDMVISVSDINIMVNIIMGQTETYPEQTDATQDGVIDINDVNKDINIILGMTPYTYVYVEPNTNDALSIKSFDIAPGETRDIEINLDNNELCSALQCDINLPQGLSIEGMSTTQRTSDHTVMSSTHGGSTRLICYSTSNQRIPGNDGAVITLKVRASEEFTSEGTLTINNIVMADASHPALFASETTATVSSTSGVDDLNARTDRVYATGNTLVIEAQEDCTAQLVTMNGASTTINLAAGRNESQPGAGIYVVVIGGKSFKVAVK